MLLLFAYSTLQPLTIVPPAECIGEMTAMKPYDPFPSDIWALGVVLINMISGAHPWMQATTTDAQFRQFLKDPDFLYRALPMSTGAYTILRETLRPQPAQRINLHDLREAIVSLDTFFRPMSEVHDAIGEDAQPQATATPGCWASLFPPRPNSVPESTSSAFDIDFLCPPSKPTVRVARHRSAGPAFNPPNGRAQPRSDTLASAFRTCLCSLWTCSCSTSRASSEVSSEENLVTPDGSTGASTASSNSNLKLWEQMMMEAYQEEEAHGDREHCQRKGSLPGVPIRSRSH